MSLSETCGPGDGGVGDPRRARGGQRRWRRRQPPRCCGISKSPCPCGCFQYTVDGNNPFNRENDKGDSATPTKDSLHSEGGQSMVQLAAGPRVRHSAPGEHHRTEAVLNVVSIADERAVPS